MSQLVLSDGDNQPVVLSVAVLVSVGSSHGLPGAVNAAVAWDPSLGV